MGIANTIASCAGFASPVVTGYLTDGQVNRSSDRFCEQYDQISLIQQTIAAWQKVFVLAALFQGTGGLLFILLCTAEVQYYNDPEWREKKKLEVENRGETIHEMSDVEIPQIH